ncbi:MAG: hypothetical protein ACNA8H_12395 [Anaerolineales bacterium]
MAKPLSRLSKPELINLIKAHPMMDCIAESDMLAACCICERKTVSTLWYVCDRCNLFTNSFE